MRARFVVGLPLALALVAAPAARAEKVASFTSATIKLEPQPPPGPPGGPPIPLDLDPNNPPDDTTDFSIPAGSTVRITVKGITSEAGVPVVHSFDDDKDEFGRGGDDELGSAAEFPPLEAGQEFEIDLFLSCATGSAVVEDLESSGEQSAEIYVRDGTQRIPLPKVLPGGGTKPWFWRIDCDKQTSLTLGPAGGTLQAVWGDSLHVPPGALAFPTEVQMANAFPLPHVEAVPAGFRDVSEALVLQPHGLALQQPALLTFRYTHEEAGDTADETTLRVFRYDPGLQEWTEVPGSSVDPANNLLSVPIDELATYGFAASTASFVPSLSPAALALAAALLLAAAAAAVAARRR